MIYPKKTESLIQYGDQKSLKPSDVALLQRITPSSNPATVSTAPANLNTTMAWFYRWAFD
jgi:hypothetical protein